MIKNGNTVNARANDGLVLNVGGVIANGKYSPFETQFTIGYKFNIASSDELVWYSVPVEVIEFYRADTLRKGLGLSYHMNSKLAGRTTDRFDNALGLVTIVGWIPKIRRSGGLDLYSVDLRYTAIKYQLSDAPNTSKIDGNSLGIYASFRYR